jgi:hypothetical protein
MFILDYELKFIDTSYLNPKTFKWEDILKHSVRVSVYIDFGDGTAGIEKYIRNMLSTILNREHIVFNHIHNIVEIRLQHYDESVIKPFVRKLKISTIE